MSQPKFNRRALLAAAPILALPITSKANIIAPGIHTTNLPPDHLKILAGSFFGNNETADCFVKIMENQWSRFIGNGASSNSLYELAAAPIILRNLMKFRFMPIHVIDLKNPYVTYLTLKDKSFVYMDDNFVSPVRRDHHNAQFIIMDAKFNFNELVHIGSQEVTLAIARSWLSFLRDKGTLKATWDFNIADGDTIKEKYNTLYTLLDTLSDQAAKSDIFKRRSNWVVAGPEISSIFETVSTGYAPSYQRDFSNPTDIQRIGRFKNYSLYKDPCGSTNSFQFGYSNSVSSGNNAWYCPQTLCNLGDNQQVFTEDAFYMKPGAENTFGTITLKNFIY